MLAETQTDLYFERMAASLKDKAKMLPYIKTGRVLDAGAGGGELTEALINLGNNTVALDGSPEAVTRLRSKGIPAVTRFTHQTAEAFNPNQFDTITCSSILHEVFSYGDNSENSALTVDSLKNSLHQFRTVLKDEGHLVIRDGVAPSDTGRQVVVTFLDPDGIRLARKYLELIPFGANSTISEERKVDFVVDEFNNRITGTMGSIMEFLYTYTWGEKSFARETQELYGVFNLKDYTQFLEGQGFEVSHAEEYLQEGYANHLAEKVVLTYADTKEIAPFPMSNCIILAVKKG